MLTIFGTVGWLEATMLVLAWLLGLLGRRFDGLWSMFVHVGSVLMDSLEIGQNFRGLMGSGKWKLCHRQVGY